MGVILMVVAECLHQSNRQPQQSSRFSSSPTPIIDTVGYHLLVLVFRRADEVVAPVNVHTLASFPPPSRTWPWWRLINSRMNTSKASSLWRLRHYGNNSHPNTPSPMPRSRHSLQRWSWTQRQTLRVRLRIKQYHQCRPGTPRRCLELSSISSILYSNKRDSLALDWIHEASWWCHGSSPKHLLVSSATAGTHQWASCGCFFLEHGASIRNSQAGTTNQRHSDCSLLLPWGIQY